jgi:hypothetical protein
MPSRLLVARHLAALRRKFNAVVFATFVGSDISSEPQAAAIQNAPQPAECFPSSLQRHLARRRHAAATAVVQV